MSYYSIFGIYNHNELLYIGMTTESLVKKLNRYKRQEFNNEPLFKEYITNLENVNVLTVKLLGIYDDIGYDRLSREGMWIQLLKPRFNTNILYD